ncbi:unnamed protein product [Leuciscus chuanchicus]
MSWSGLALLETESLMLTAQRHRHGMVSSFREQVLSEQHVCLSTSARYVTRIMFSPCQESSLLIQSFTWNHTHWAVRIWSPVPLRGSDTFGRPLTGCQLRGSSQVNPSDSLKSNLRDFVCGSGRSRSIISDGDAITFPETFPKIKHCPLKQSRHWLFFSLSTSGIQERPPSPRFLTNHRSQLGLETDNHFSTFTFPQTLQMRERGREGEREDTLGEGGEALV